jgi:hypothetical protein
MKKILLLLYATCFFCCCNPGKNLIDNNNINFLRINFSDLKTNGILKTCDITDKKKIEKIVNALNDCTHELWLFKPQCNVIIFYNNRLQKNIYCSVNHIRINGLTYKINSPIDEILK